MKHKRDWFKDLTPIQMATLMRLYFAWRYEGYNMSIQEVAKYIGCKKATADQHVRCLRAYGYVIQDVKNSNGIVIASAVRNYLEVNKDGLHRIISAYSEPRVMPGMPALAARIAEHGARS